MPCAFNLIQVCFKTKPDCLKIRVQTDLKIFKKLLCYSPVVERVGKYNMFYYI